MRYLHSLTANMDKSAEKIAKKIKMNEIVDDYEIRLRVKDLPAGVYLLALRDAGNSQNCDHAH